MASALLCLSEKLTVLGVDGREPAGLCASRSAFTLLPAASAAVHPRQGTHPRTNSSSTTNQPWPRTLIQIALQLLLPACVAVCSHPEIPGPAYSEAASQIWPTKDSEPRQGPGPNLQYKNIPTGAPQSLDEGWVCRSQRGVAILPAMPADATGWTLTCQCFPTGHRLGQHQQIAFFQSQRLKVPSQGASPYQSITTLPGTSLHIYKAKQHLSNSTRILL